MSVQRLERSTIPHIYALAFGLAFSFAMTAAIWAAGDWLSQVELRPKRPIPFWYPWVSASPTTWTHLSAWAGYALHQVTIWGLIFYAQTRKTGYSTQLGPANLWALAANAFFVLLHFIQTHVFYDGLALDVPEQSSQWSVILLLVLVLLMENQRRGLIGGQIVKAPFLTEAARVVRKYHGYYFSWAIIYTFWYHPMVSTPGHLVGFLYMFLLLLQGSLFLTPIHVNRWWTFTLEISVLFHATVVALNQTGDHWAMFFFGFAGVFIVTQMHGLGLSKLTRWLFLGLYVGLALVVYSRIGMERIYQVTLIPITDYALVIALAAVLWLSMKAYSALQRVKPTA